MPTTTRRARRLAAALTALTAVLLPVTGPASADATDRTAAQAVPRTEVTVRTVGCDHCRVQLFQAIEGRSHIWQTRNRRAVAGKVTFSVPTSRTHGMTMTVRAPWESSNGIPTGYVTTTVFRYRGESPGSSVDLASARTHKRAFGCWAGTDQAAKTLRVTVRKVRVHGTTGMTDGSIAWLKVQGRTWKPAERAVRGVLGTQDVLVCTRP